MKKLLIIFLIFLPFCKTEKRNLTTELLFLSLAVGELNSSKEQIVFNNAQRLTGELGQVEYRGLDHFDNRVLNGMGKYNWQEAGDATLYTGKTLQAMAWRYKNKGDSETLALIGKYIQYYKTMQSLRGGAFGRNFVDINAYNQFPECNKNGTVGATLDNQSCGTMRYVDFTQNGKQYKFRYDFSLDATIHSLVGLYWTHVFVPQYRTDIVQIANNLLTFYEANSYQVKDDNNVNLRYGNHDPTLNPIAKINEVILKRLARNETPSLGVAQTLLSLGRTYDGTIVKVEDTNFFNHYMMIKGLAVLVHMGYNLENGLRNSIAEVNNQNNELADAIDIYFFKTLKIHVKDKSGFPLYNYHCIADQTFGEVFGLIDRRPYSKWEFSPVPTCIVKQPSELGLNSDFMEAFWWL